MRHSNKFNFKSWSTVGKLVIACLESRQLKGAMPYIIAVGIFAVALAVRLLVLPVEPGLAYLTYYPGTAVTALLCGMGPSLFYILLAALVGANIFVPPYWAFSQDALVPAVAFMVAAATILFVIQFYQRIVARQRLTQTYTSCHDNLTKLSNRAVFQDQLRHAIVLAQREEQLLAVLLIDLDNFKTINDTLGHDMGDLLLVDVAQRLLRCIRDGDSVARMGGDEFAVLLNNIESVEVNVMCRRILAALRQPFRIIENELRITASIGVSLFPNDGDDACALLKNADVAMYHAKEKGKNKFRLFAADIKHAVLRHHALEVGLRHAQQRELFSLHYQPKIRIADGAMVGAEALIRWSDPELGIVSPAEFIPVAEKVGLIGSIGLFVISRAVADITYWYSVGLKPPPIAVNISPSQLRDDCFGEWMLDGLDKAGLSPSSIVLELTEGALMEQGEAGLDVLNGLASRGIKISIDDFGTGYSSLSYLKRMPIAELKIDRSFVDGIAAEPDDRAIANAILSLAHTLGFSVVAEGVETEQQLTVLRELGCDNAQGHLFYRPMAPDQFRLLLPAESIAGEFGDATLP